MAELFRAEGAKMHTHTLKSFVSHCCEKQKNYHVTVRT